MKVNNMILVLSVLSVSSSFAAFNDENTDYSNVEQKSYVWNEALEPIELVNSILCFTSQFNSLEFVNTGAYLILADEAACFDEEGGTDGQSSGANATTYMKVISSVTRSNDFSPLIVNAWMPEMGDGNETQAIKFKAEVSQGATDANPFGSFTFNFDLFESFDTNNQRGTGEVVTVDDVPGSIGFTIYEQYNADGQTNVQRASVVMSSDRTSGTALTGFDRGAYGEESYALTFNSTHVLMQSVNGDFSDLPYKSGNNTGTCYSRTEFNDVVHRYDLFSASTGSRVSVNSGFSIKYDGDNNGSFESYGFIGYWGLWTEQNGGIVTGDTVVRETAGSSSNYTAVVAPGRLIKNSVKTLALSQARGILFSYWDSAIFSDPNYDQWVVNYLTVTADSVGQDGFYKTGKLKWGESGPEVAEITPTLIPLSTNDSLYMYSDQLGGEVKYLEGKTSLTYYEQTFINGSETGSGELLNSGSVTFTCYDNCPIGTFQSTDLVNYSGTGSPYETTTGPFSFTFSNTGSNALTLVSSTSSEPVRFASSLTESDISSSPHSWGVRSGPMIIGSVSNPWDIYDPAITTEFYVWETGLQTWNQMATLKDSSGNYLSFDRPIQFTYQHTSANDRSGNAGVYAQQTFLLNYGGNGSFWGVPSATDGDGRYQPAFSIADGVVMGSSNQYVIKALEIEQTMQTAPGECGSLVLSDPAAPVPTGVTGDANIGTMPTVSDEPAVIAGVTQ